MKSAIYTFITQQFLINSGDTVIVGLSGGPDSVCLLHILNSLKKELNITLVAAHLNHGWRSEAYNDQLFCKDLCEALNITFESAHASELAITINSKKSLEERGRLLRRFYFNTLKQKYNATSIALAHHKDDQIETFLIRLMRGSSIDGLGCMRAKKDGYIRPLLNNSKQEILEYLTDNKLHYCMDSTNESSLFLRNKLRKVIPHLAACDQRFEKNTLKAIHNIQETHDALQKIVAESLAKITLIEDNNRVINLKIFHNESKFMQKHLIAQWLMQHKVTYVLTTSFINEIIKFLQGSKGGTHKIHTSWTIVKKNNTAYIRKIITPL